MKNISSCLLFILILGLKSIAQNTTILDNKFEQALIDLGYDSAPIDGSVPTANISAVTSLDISNKGIEDLTGIEDFTALKFLSCDNNSLSSLDVSKNTALTVLSCENISLSRLDVSKNTALNYLYCNDNSLGSLDVSNNTALTYLSCENNSLGSLDVSNNTALANLYCNDNSLSSLNVSNNTVLTNLYCNNNSLSSLNVSNNTVLTNLYCNNNSLSSLNVSNNTALANLYCKDNSLSSLDVSKNTALTILYCYNNNLSSLNIKNGNNTKLNGVNATNNPSLTCINVDDVAYSTLNWFNGIDPTARFSLDCTTLGINNIEQEYFSFHPNPVEDVLYINLSHGLNLKAINIYNSLGKQVLSTTRLDINTKVLCNGFYFIEVETNQGRIVKKLVKK